MEITGKSLRLAKKAAEKYCAYCSLEATRASHEEATDKWEPEIKETQLLIRDMELNIQREDEEYVRAPSACGISPDKKSGRVSAGTQ